MKKNSLFIFAFIFGSVLTSNATILPSNTSIIRHSAVGIQNLEWLKFEWTQGKSRDYVERKLLNTNDYNGYRYATREEAALLLDSYYDDILTKVDDGWSMSTISAANNFFKDFGYSYEDAYNKKVKLTTFEGEKFKSDFYRQATFMYGADTFTIKGVEKTLLGHVAIHSFHKEFTAGWFYDGHGTDPTLEAPMMYSYPDIPTNYSSFSSLLVRETKPVPEPSTILLFGAGLVGLVGFRSRRKKTD